jgi:hypothetical protein
MIAAPGAFGQHRCTFASETAIFRGGRCQRAQEPVLATPIGQVMPFGPWLL